MHIQVLLSTFNGETFLLPQLQSILQQRDVDVSILIRDDGSQDRTVSLIKEQMQFHSNIQLIEGQNIGVVPSFFALMDAANLTCDAFAFCDQDDVWLPDKLSTAVRALSKVHQPALFASPAFITADGQNPQGQTSIPQKPLTLANALVQNRLIGCTVVFNAPALNLVQKHRPDVKRVNMHDWWLYLVVSAFGVIIFHQSPLVLYRQHASNVVGLKSDSLSARLARFKLNERNCSKQASAFLEAFAECLAFNQISLVQAVAQSKTLWQRITLAVSGRVYRQTWLDNLILKVLLILDRI